MSPAWTPPAAFAPGTGGVEAALEKSPWVPEQKEPKSLGKPSLAQEPGSSQFMGSKEPLG